MLPKKFAPILFGLLLSGLMSLIVSGISTFRMIGLTASFTNIWIGAWLTAWLFAFPAVLFAAPITRRIVQKLIKQ